MKSFATKAIHGGLPAKDAHGSLRMPVYDSVAFEHEDSRSLSLSFAGKKPAHVYSRISNPTVQDFEQKIRQVSGATGVLAVASGMAAISNTLLTLAGAGTNIITAPHLFGNTYSLFAKTFRSWGLEVRFVPLSDTAKLEEAIDENTRAVYFESMTNPQLEVIDCEAISQVTQKYGIPLVVDNTILTPYLFETKKAGIDIELLSTTKYISGGATSLGGIIIDNGTFDWSRSPKLQENARKMGPMAFIATLRQEIFRNVGACMTPHNAYLHSLGLETMALRIEKSCTNTRLLAEYLMEQQGVHSVHYPGLLTSPFHHTARKQFNNKFGGILTFDLKDEATCFAFADNLQVIRRATNVNDNKTLILHPSSTIFGEFSDQEKLAMDIRPTTLRLSVGIEEPEDLIDDLKRGFEAI